jgi:hypothetical protein
MPNHPTFILNRTQPAHPSGIFFGFCSLYAYCPDTSMFQTSYITSQEKLTLDPLAVRQIANILLGFSTLRTPFDKESQECLILLLFFFVSDTIHLPPFSSLFLPV